VKQEAVQFGDESLTKECERPGSTIPVEHAGSPGRSRTSAFWWLCGLLRFQAVDFQGGHLLLNSGTQNNDTLLYEVVQYSSEGCIRTVVRHVTTFQSMTDCIYNS